MLALQRSAGNAAVCGLLRRSCGPGCDCADCGGHDEEQAVPSDGSVAVQTMPQEMVQRGEGEGAEETAPTEGGAEAGGLGDIACTVLPDSAVVWLVRQYFRAYPHARAALDHYLYGGGRDFDVNVADLLSANPRARDRIARRIGSGHRVGERGQWIDRTSSGAPIRQADYDSNDWRLALGGIDEVDWEIVGEPGADGMTTVRISIVDPYEWHPQEDRGTQCLHEVMERQKQRGARNYDAVGSAEVQLRL